nr:prolyl oligopeptidase family serine peptidase [uncultured Actinoplanes sp.]
MNGQLWRRRFHVAQITAPQWARNAPHRCLYRSNACGKWELYAWDREAGTHRQVTRRSHGTGLGAIDSGGAWIWWFADTDGDEFGVWRRQPFDGGDDEIAVPGSEPGYPAGMAFLNDGSAVLGYTNKQGTTIQVCRAGQAAEPIYAHVADAYVASTSSDGHLVALGHSEHGDSRHRAIRVVTVDGSVVGDLWDGPGRGLGGAWDGPGKGLRGVSFSPAPGDTRVLVEHERQGRPAPLIWDPLTGEEREIDIRLPGELGAAWYVDARALLIFHAHQARDELYRYDLSSGALDRLPTPPGVVRGAVTRPDCSVEYVSSSAAEPPSVRSTAGGVILTAPGSESPPSVRVQDLWVNSPNGPIHALVSRPRTGEAPYPCVFEVHGGPIGYDDDAYDPRIAAWVDHGFAVVQVNYRGSTGYGSAWRDAIEGRPGLTELEDISAVRAHVIDNGFADSGRLVLSGRSWGGYLVLLGLGTRPGDWCAGIAAEPVADYLTAYEDETEALRAYDRSLMGGSPEEVPERYRASSPLTYVDSVAAPVLIIAGENDPRCPIRQIVNYVARLRDLGLPHDVYRYDAGHSSLVVEERIRHMEVTVDFAVKHVH